MGQRIANAASSSSSSMAAGKGQEERAPTMVLGRNEQMSARAEYEAGLPEWKLHCLLSEHGLPAPIKSQLLFGGLCF